MDALGSTVALTDSAGHIQTEYLYEPFGATNSVGTPSLNSLQYAARENDGIGIYYYRARYYDPRTGRFNNEDPIGLGGGTVNLYSYAKNSPITRSDPTGLVSDSCGDPRGDPRGIESPSDVGLYEHFGIPSEAVPYVRGFPGAAGLAGLLTASAPASVPAALFYGYRVYNTSTNMYAFLSAPHSPVPGITGPSGPMPSSATSFSGTRGIGVVGVTAPAGPLVLPTGPSPKPSKSAPGDFGYTRTDGWLVLDELRHSIGNSLGVRRTSLGLPSISVLFCEQRAQKTDA
jgi:RHS repeat-associated protein